jgi:hypothetical protein
MSERDNGGPAFPHDGRDNGPGNIKGRPHDGMTLRDWFAGQALTGVSSALQQVGLRSGENQAKADARWAYERADAMLEARK